MPEVLAAAVTLPQWGAVFLVTFVAGVVYGFAGFGAALVFLPIATVFVSPVTAIAAFSVSAMSSLVTLVPRAWKECDRKTTLGMIVAANLTLPLGVVALRVADPALIRVAISGLAAVTLAALIAGFRFRIRPRLGASLTVAAAAGAIGGATGLLGPVVILFNLASGDGAARMRANTLVFLTLGSLLVIPQLALQGLITWPQLWLGLSILPAYAVGALCGRHLFDPGRELLYRRVAYGLIALSIVLGLWRAAG